MLCYKDQWWCASSENCANSDGCDRVLTDRDKDNADKLGLFINMVCGRPDCFEEEKTCGIWAAKPGLANT